MVGISRVLPQIRHGCEATNMGWAVSRCSFRSLNLGSLFWILAGTGSFWELVTTVEISAPNLTARGQREATFPELTEFHTARGPARS